MPTSSSQPNSPQPHSSSGYTSGSSGELSSGELVNADSAEVYEEQEFCGDQSPAKLVKAERAERRKRHVRLFCFSCNRYEGHSVAARSRLLYSFVLGLSFGLYYYFGRFSCHCCGTVRLARYDWLNARFWYRTIWIGGSARARRPSSKAKSKTRHKGSLD